MPGNTRAAKAIKDSDVKKVKEYMGNPNGKITYVPYASLKMNNGGLDLTKLLRLLAHFATNDHYALVSGLVSYNTATNGGCFYFRLYQALMHVFETPILNKITSI